MASLAPLFGGRTRQTSRNGCLHLTCSSFTTCNCERERRTEKYVHSITAFLTCHHEAGDEDRFLSSCSGLQPPEPFQDGEETQTQVKCDSSAADFWFRGWITERGRSTFIRPGAAAYSEPVPNEQEVTSCLRQTQHVKMVGSCRVTSN